MIKKNICQTLSNSRRAVKTSPNHTQETATMSIPNVEVASPPRKIFRSKMERSAPEALATLRTVPVMSGLMTMCVLEKSRIRVHEEVNIYVRLLVINIFMVVKTTIISRTCVCKKKVEKKEYSMKQVNIYVRAVTSINISW